MQVTGQHQTYVYMCISICSLAECAQSSFPRQPDTAWSAASFLVFVVVPDAHASKFFFSLSLFQFKFPAQHLSVLFKANTVLQEVKLQGFYWTLISVQENVIFELDPSFQLNYDHCYVTFRPLVTWFTAYCPLPVQQVWASSSFFYICK